jgi:GAF domain-containing protein
MHTLDADVVVIHQYLKDQDQFEIPPVTRGTLMFPDSLGKPHRSSILWRFVGLPESVFESDVRQNLLFLDTVPGGFAVREEIASAAVLILRTVEPDEVVGLVFVNYRTKREFQDEDIQAMNALASSAAIAIRTARERERAQRSVTRLERELAAVGAAPKAILAGRGTMSPQTVLDLLLKEAVEITAAEAGVVLWRHRSEFEVRSETPLRGLSKNLRIAGTDEIIKTILTARRTVVFSDVTSARAASTRPIVSAAVRSQLLAPMFDNDVLLGVIVLEHSSIAKFSEEDRRFLDALTVQGLIVLNAIDMYDQLQRQIMPQRALTTIATRIQDTSQSLDTALRLLLTGVTAEPGIAFSRAMLLTFDEAGTELRGRLASGALTREAAEYSWKNIERKLQGVAPENALSALLDEAEQAGREAPGRRPIDPLTDRVQRITFKADSLLGAMGAAIRSGRPQQVASDQADPWRALLADTSPYTFACCPLVWQEEKLGVLVVDDRFLPRERARIEESRLVNLVSFADMISLVILNAKLRDRSQAEAFRDLEHQLRSPLHTASAIVNDLATAPEGEFRKKCETLQRVLAKARRVSGSIRLYAESAGNQSIHLRDLVRLRAKMVSDMLGDAIHEGELQRDDLLLSVDGLSLAAFESVAVEFDRILLEQVFGNIFDNVFKYAAQGTEVRVRAGQSEGGVTLAIENVAFLTEDEAQRSMERGFRGDVAEEVTGEGSGLGLWIVDHIMQAHSGSARLRVEDGNRVITELFFREVVSDAHRNR